MTIVAGPAAAERLFLGNVVVMHVERSRLEQDMVGHILRGFGVRRASRCATAAEARALLAQAPADLLIAGTELGDITGLDLVKWLRQSRLACRDAPVILAAGYPDQAFIRQARESGVSVVVVKPITPAILFERLSWMAGEDRPSQARYASALP